MPTCVNAVPGYDSDFESQGLSDVESKGCNEQCYGFEQQQRSSVQVASRSRNRTAVCE